ncbi:MAG: hypothetical protein IPJ32_09360 [Sphingobacteriaceae bacterium]|nr:hypothetical protein [Sphingobacteriaceae bacterium]
MINELKTLAGVNYNIDSYRAGGWCLQPFNVFKPYFEKYGIKYDFSALRGSSLQGKNIFYDYTNIPAKSIYKFSDAVVNQDKNGGFTEFVITSVNVSKTKHLLNKFLNKYLWYTKNTSFGDGYSAVDSETTVINSAQKLKKQTKDKTEMASIELLTLFTLSVYKETLDENDFMHFISHPKMISKHNLDMLEGFLKYAGKNYNVNTDYIKMLD